MLFKNQLMLENMGRKRDDGNDTIKTCEAIQLQIFEKFSWSKENKNRVEIPGSQSKNFPGNGFKTAVQPADRLG